MSSLSYGTKECGMERVRYGLIGSEPSNIALIVGIAITGP